MTGTVRVPAETPAWREKFDQAASAYRTLPKFHRRFVFRAESNKTWYMVAADLADHFTSIRCPGAR